MSLEAADRDDLKRSSLGQTLIFTFDKLNLRYMKTYLIQLIGSTRPKFDAWPKGDLSLISLDQN